MNSRLKNKTIVITRSSDQANESIKKLESLGAIVIPFPTIKIRPIKIFNHFDNYAADLDKFDYLIFTSDNAVKFSLERMHELNLRIPENVQVVCVGKKTADKCEELGIKVDIVPKDYSSKGLIEYFSDKDVEDKRFFMPSSAIARSELRYALIKQSADVIQIPIYDVGLPGEEDRIKGRELIESSNPDLFVFTSPSTFRNSIKILKLTDPKKYFKKYIIAAIGPTTAANMKDVGVAADIVPDNYTMDDLIDAIIDFYTKQEESN